MAVRRQPPKAGSKKPSASSAAPKQTPPASGSYLPRGVTTELGEIKNMLTITPNLDVEMARQAALFSQFAVAAELAEDRMERLTTQLKLYEAEADVKIRQQLIKNGEKPTNVSVEAAVHRTEGWKKLSFSILDAKRDRGILRAAARAFDQRAVMLSGLAANRRAETGQDNAGQSVDKGARKASSALQNSFGRHTADAGDPDDAGGWE